MRDLLRGAALTACAMLAASVAWAQTGGSFDLSWNTLDGGGGRSGGGSFELVGTVGQIDAGTHLGGGSAMLGGFWKGGSALGTTAIGDDPASTALPRAFAVRGAAPNPFAAATQVRFDLPDARPVRVNVYDVRGALVRTVTDRQYAAGRHAVRWDGRDAQQRSVAPGVYLVRVCAGADRREARLVRIP